MVDNDSLNEYRSHIEERYVQKKQGELSFETHDALRKKQWTPKNPIGRNT